MALTAGADLAVVGGGIVGLATARAFQRRFPPATAVLPQAARGLGRGQTRPNPRGVPTGGFYAPGSLKAKLCVEGASLMRAYCAEHDIPVVRCGKLIVATSESEVDRLGELERRGHANGVPGLMRLSSGDISEREPNVQGLAALWSPQAAVVDFRRVALALAADIVKAGGHIETAWAATRATDSQVVATDGRVVAARRIIVCAGIRSDRLAVASGAPRDPRVVPFCGTYLHVRPERQKLVSSMIYPVPDPALPFLGVHLTPTADGGLTIGPTALPVPMLRTALWPGALRMAWRHRRSVARELEMAARRKAVVAAAQRYVPSLSAQDVAPGSTFGVRAQAVGRDGTLLDDFVFSDSGSVLHVRNAPSPAATSALAIGELLAAR